MSIQINLENKKAVVFGVANDQSIAWAIAKKLNEAGCSICFAYQDRVESMVKPLFSTLKKVTAHPCDVVDDVQLDAFFEKVKVEFGHFDFLIHSIAFAKKENLQGKYYDVNRRGFQIANEVSSYSLAELTRRSLPLMNEGGSIVAMTYLGSERVIENYNMMGVAKAALEASIRYIAYDVGEMKIRVNGISAGPIKTLAASGVSGFDSILGVIEKKAPLKRNISQEDVGNAALFLCSDLSKNITGHIMYVDCGYNIMGM